MENKPEVIYRSVYKCSNCGAIVNEEDVFEIEVPKNSEVLCVNTVNKVNGPQPSIWFLVAPHCEETEKREFIVRGTGHGIYEHSDYIKYLGTFFIVDRTLVFHVFEVIA